MAKSAGKIALHAILPVLLSSQAWAQAPTHYEPTLASLNQHPLPQWYDDAKLGIFVHWGLYSVPGWATLQHPEHDFGNKEGLAPKDASPCEARQKQPQTATISGCPILCEPGSPARAVFACWGEEAKGGKAIPQPNT